MSLHKFRSVILGLTASVFGFATLGCMTEDRLKQWVLDNPEVIMESVMKHQQAEQERNQPSPDMVKENHAELFEGNSSPVAGNSSGKVKIAYFFDFNCGHCARQSETIASVLESNDNVKVVYKNFPVLGPSSDLAARAALAAHQQGRFQDFYKEIYQTRDRNPEAFKGIAQKLSLDVSKWEKDMQSETVNAELEATRDLAQKMRIGGTPFLAIAPDQVFPGRVDELKAIVESMN